MNASPLTADLIASAIVAAARVYGVHPLQPFNEAPGDRARTAVRAAAVGVAHATGGQLHRAYAILGLDADSVGLARRSDVELFDRARLAAHEAASDHLPQTLSRANPKPAPAQPKSAKRQAQAPAFERPLRERILDVLRDAPCTAPNIAMLTDAKELTVSQALSGLHREGFVEPGPITQFGARHRSWSIKERSI